MSTNSALYCQFNGAFLLLKVRHYFLLIRAVGISKYITIVVLVQTRKRTVNRWNKHFLKLLEKALYYTNLSISPFNNANRVNNGLKVFPEMSTKIKLA